MSSDVKKRKKKRDATKETFQQFNFSSGSVAEGYFLLNDDDIRQFIMLFQSMGCFDKFHVKNVLYTSKAWCIFRSLQPSLLYF